MADIAAATKPGNSMKLFALEGNSNQCDVFRARIRSGRALWGGARR
jgi:hypothetical protein